MFLALGTLVYQNNFTRLVFIVVPIVKPIDVRVCCMRLLVACKPGCMYAELFDSMVCYNVPNLRFFGTCSIVVQLASDLAEFW